MQDWGLNLNLSKSIDFGEKSIFSMEPSITLNASTLGYFTEYVKKTIKIPNTVGLSYKTTTNLQGINVLDYELALPITISFKKVEICLNPIFIMPVNPIKTITTIENKKTKLIESIIISTPICERNLESFLYWGLSFTYKIN